MLVLPSPYQQPNDSFVHHRSPSRKKKQRNSSKQYLKKAAEGLLTAQYYLHMSDKCPSGCYVMSNSGPVIGFWKQGSGDQPSTSASSTTTPGIFSMCLGISSIPHDPQRAEHRADSPAVYRIN